MPSEAFRAVLSAVKRRNLPRRASANTAFDLPLQLTVNQLIFHSITCSAPLLFILLGIAVGLALRSIFIYDRPWDKGVAGGEELPSLRQTLGPSCGATSTVQSVTHMRKLKVDYFLPFTQPAIRIAREARLRPAYTSENKGGCGGTSAQNVAYTLETMPKTDSKVPAKSGGSSGCCGAKENSPPVKGSKE